MGNQACGIEWWRQSFNWKLTNSSFCTCTAKKSQNHPKCCQTLHELKAMPLRKTVVSHFVPEVEILPFLCMLNKKGKKHKKRISINKICFLLRKLGCRIEWLSQTFDRTLMNSRLSSREVKIGS